MSPPHATTVRFDDTPPPATCAKRGISIPWNFRPRHFALYTPAIEAGNLSWLCNWELRKPKGLPPNITFIPQCRTAKEASQVQRYLTRYLSDEQTHHFMYVQGSVK